MKLVILESPYAGKTPEEIARNVDYARRCLRDSLLRGEAPIASHLLYTQPGVLRDEIPAERQHGIDAGLAWREVAHGTVVYMDLGITNGMAYGIEKARRSGRDVELRQLGKPQQSGHCGDCPFLITTGLPKDLLARCAITQTDLSWHDYFLAECSPPRWFLHVWAAGEYAGAYPHDTEAEAEADYRDRREQGLVQMGYRYQVTNSPLQPRACDSCQKANRSCPVYPQEWQDCKQHQAA